MAVGWNLTTTMSFVKAVLGLSRSLSLWSRLSVTPPAGSLVSPSGSLVSPFGSLVSLSGLRSLSKVRVAVFPLMTPICISVE